MFLRSRAWSGSIVAISLLLMACGGQSTAPAAKSGSAKGPAIEDLAALEAAAVKEGELMLYTGFPEKEINTILAAFGQKYPGIKGSVLRDTGTAIAQRFETETRANRHAADLIAAGAMPQIPKWREQGMLASFNLPEMQQYADKYKDKDGYWVWTALSGYGLMYNTSLVSDADAPKSWESVFDPKWKGKLAMVPPWAADTPLEWAYYVENELKIADAAKKMAAQEPLLASVGANAAQAVVSGERSVGLTQDWVFVGLKSKGAPIGFLYPSEGATITSRPVVLSSKAPHPNAAKLFLNWFLSTEGQAMVVETMGYYSVREGQSQPTGLPKLSELKGYQVDPDALAKADKDIAQRWREAFGQ